MRMKHVLVSLIIVHTSCLLSGCARTRVEVTPAQFELAYSAPRFWTGYGEYVGVSGQEHRLYVYELRRRSTPEHICTFVVPVAAMPADFPGEPQQPISHHPLSDAEMEEWARAWSELPGCPLE